MKSKSQSFSDSMYRVEQFLEPENLVQTDPKKFLED